MTEFYTPADLRTSFHSKSYGDFEHINSQGFGKPNPVSTIARVALDRLVSGAEIKAPVGYDREVLERTNFMSGYYSPQRVSGTQAAELAFIADQLLDLDKVGGIKPPLSTGEHQEINYVINQVEKSIPNWKEVVRVPGTNFPGEATTITSALPESQALGQQDPL
ncbi:MAG: hypothetical protein ABI220_02200 [Candidatus Saccharimonadales bacterium]